MDGTRKRRLRDEHRTWWYGFFRSLRFARRFGFVPKELPLKV